MKAKYLVILAISTALAGVVLMMLQFDREEPVPAPVEQVVYPPDVVNPLDGIPADELAVAGLRVHAVFRSGAAYMQMRTAAGWCDLFMKGVNLGVAMPGKFATQFSLSQDEYYRWFDLISRMNANVIRIYTILPPGFYDALLRFNLMHADRPLYLLQGVWMRPPAEDRYSHPDATREFRQEIVRAVDVLHGRAHLRPRPGSAYGVYVSDLSAYTAGIILGHEWDPYCIGRTNREGGGEYNGNYISVHGGTAMEQWLGRMLDYTVTYQTWTYGFQVPVSFINWQATDPMYHNSAYAVSRRGAAYDTESLDFSRFHSHPGFRSGLFASYHAYPYFPDFVYRDPAYTGTHNHMGNIDNFLAYVKALRDRHPGMPVVISEYGLSSSRGNSRFNPFGFHQGGHSEAEHADLVRIMTEDVHRSGCAGAVYFEWCDEWFKNNWLVKDYEMPQERRVFWHNAENPEQHYGILAVEAPGKTVDGFMDDWNRQLRKGRNGIMAAHDPAYFYLALHLPDFDCEQGSVAVALDTYDPDAGVRRVPFSEKILPSSAEFLLRFNSKENAEILVDSSYRLKYVANADSTKCIVPSVRGTGGRWVSQRLPLNSESQDVHGNRPDSAYYNRGLLQYGRSDRAATSNADWFWDGTTEIMEIRLPWQLLQFSDPSSRAVVYYAPGVDSGFAVTDGIGIMAWRLDGPEQTVTAVHRRRPVRYHWEGWDLPAYRTRLKAAYAMFRKAFAHMQPLPESSMPKEGAVAFTLCRFRDGCNGALSLRLEGGGYSQYEVAAPLLYEVRATATFALCGKHVADRPGVVADAEGLGTLRIGVPQVEELRQAGHQVVPDSGRSARRPQVILSGDTLTTASMVLALDRGRGIWTLIRYRHFAAGNSVRGITPDLFRRHLRLARNSRLWIAPQNEVAAYIVARNATRLHSRRLSGHIWECSVSGTGTTTLSVRCTVPYGRVRVAGSKVDGIYAVRDGAVVVAVVSGTTIRLEGLE